MTREELRDYVDEQRTLDNIPYHVYSALIDGIDTLEQEPTTKNDLGVDLISRADVLKLMQDNWHTHNGDWAMQESMDDIRALPSVTPQEPRWIPVSERLPSKEERKEWIDKNLGGIGYLYPCFVTRYSSINPDRTKNNPYVAKHYFDGEDFLNAGEEVCSEYIIAWMPLPTPYEPQESEG